MSSKFCFAVTFVLLICIADGEDASARHSPPTMTRKLFRGTRGALRLGVAGVDPVRTYEDFPRWRRFFNAWNTRVEGPFTAETSELDLVYYTLDSNGTKWTVDAREQFSVSLPDETLQRLGSALGHDVSYSHVEVVLTGNALSEPQSYDYDHDYVFPPSHAVDAYLLFVGNSSDVAQARLTFKRRDQRHVAHHFHSAKWAIRKETSDKPCEYDVWKKAHTTLQAGGSLTTVNWSESELELLAGHELQSLKPIIFIVNASRQDYTRQDPVLVDATVKWVRENQLEEHQPEVILTSIELEEELAQRSLPLENDVVSVFDGILGRVLRYLRLTRFYVLHDIQVHAWYIPANTRADQAAGVVFHRPCDTRYFDHRPDFCTTHYYHFNETARRDLVNVDVGRADVFASHNTHIHGGRDFATKDREYRLQDGDVVKFTLSGERNSTMKEPETPCVGFEDVRPRMLHPVGSALRICIVGLPNAGKTRLFNNLTGADDAVSPKLFTTRYVTARTTKTPDDRFEWLERQFPAAMLRPSVITFVDTPALVYPFDDVVWRNEVFDALRGCDIFYHVTRAFSDASVELWKAFNRDYGYENWGTSKSKHVQSSHAVFDIMTAHDMEVVRSLLRNDTHRDDFDALEAIVDNIRGFRTEDSTIGSVNTDERARYHDWEERELAVLERIRLLTAKPVVYVINLDEQDFENASSTTAFLRTKEHTADDDFDDASRSVFLEARTYIEAHDKDALVLPFAGRTSRDGTKASPVDVGELSGAHSIIQKTIEHCHVGHLYTANEHLVAAWAIKLGATIEEAIQLVNATLDSNVTVVEAVSMRSLVEAGSIGKARRLGMMRRLRFEDEVEDEDLLLLTPGRLEEGDTLDSTAITVLTSGSRSLAAPTGDEGIYVASWAYISLTFNVLLLTLLALSIRNNLADRLRTYLESRRPREEGLLDAVSFHADSDSVGF